MIWSFNFLGTPAFLSKNIQPRFPCIYSHASQPSIATILVSVFTFLYCTIQRMYTTNTIHPLHQFPISVMILHFTMFYIPSNVTLITCTWGHGETERGIGRQVFGGVIDTCYVLRDIVIRSTREAMAWN